MWSFGVINIIVSLQFQSFNELKFVVLDTIFNSFWPLLIQRIFLSSFYHSFKEIICNSSGVRAVFYGDFDEIEVSDGFVIVALKESKVAKS